MMIQRNLFQRVFGICSTTEADPGCWRVAAGRVVIELAREPKLASPGGAVRLEKGRGLKKRLLVFRNDDGKLYAMENRCTHGGRRLDANAKDGVVQCCSVGRSEFDLEGHAISGAATKDVQLFPVEEMDGRLLVDV